VDPFIGEIRIFGGSYAPQGWAFCDGQLLPIAQYDALFALLGTTYGGDGQETFALPDLRGRAPVHMGTGSSGTPYDLGDQGGVETVTLTTSQIPAHSHGFIGTTNPGGTTNPATNILGQNSGNNIYIEDQATVALAPQSLLPDGGSQPHENLQPFLCVAFIISLFGAFPTPS
jgi:microcystin-dependent protein